MDSGDAPPMTKMSSRRQSMKNALLPITEARLPRQLTMALDTLQMNGLSTPERNAVIARLARLLMEAAGVEIEEGADDER
jgi:hypothetical protein